MSRFQVVFEGTDGAQHSFYILGSDLETTKEVLGLTGLVVLEITEEPQLEELEQDWFPEQEPQWEPDWHLEELTDEYDFVADDFAFDAYRETGYRF